MLILPTILMALVFVMGRSFSVPLIALSVPWLVSMFPITTGLVRFNLYSEFDLEFELILTGYLLCYVVGVLTFRLVSGKVCGGAYIHIENKAQENMNTAIVCTILGWIGAIFLAINFSLRGLSFSDFDALHTQFTPGSSTLFLSMANLCTWGGLFSYVYVLIYWGKMSVTLRLFLMSSTVGYILGGVMAAGRQAMFTITLITAITFLLRIGGENSGVLTRKSKVLALLILFSLFATYSLAIGLARNNDTISNSHSLMLRAIFMYTPSEFFEILFGWSDGLNDFMEAFVAYFSATPVQFRVFLLVDTPISFGAMEYPFIARQLSFLTGLDYFDALQTRRLLLQAAGAAPAGWATAFSSSISDFGRIGACIYVFLHGFYAEYLWARVRRTGDYLDLVLFMILIIATVYLIMLPVTTETPVLLLFGFILILRYYRAAQSRQLGRRSDASEPYGSHKANVRSDWRRGIPHTP